MVPYLKKLECQTNLQDEVQPKGGGGLFIGIVEQQLPTAMKTRVRAEPFQSLQPPSPSTCISFCAFLLFVPLSVSKHTKYSRELQAQGLHKEQQRGVGQARGTKATETLIPYVW